MVYVIFVIYNVTCTNVIYNTIPQYKQHSYIDLLHHTVRTANRTQPVSLAVVVAVAWRLSVYRRDWNITHPYIIWFGPRNDIYFYFRLSFIEIESIWRSFFFFYQQFASDFDWVEHELPHATTYRISPGGRLCASNSNHGHEAGTVSEETWICYTYDVYMNQSCCYCTEGVQANTLSESK